MIASGRQLGRLRGLLGRLLAILLLTVAVEFGASTLLYERASRFSVREDEARRLAEYLSIARKLVSERPIRERPAMAAELASDHYDARWLPSLPPPPVTAELAGMRAQIIAWEPVLGRADLRLRLVSPDRHARVVGGLRLTDGSWLHFGAWEIAQGWDLVLGRIALALIPAIGLLLLGALLVRHTLRPLRVLARAADRVGHGRTVIVPEEGTTEVRDLVRAFNAMQERIHDLIDERTQALAAVGHDLRTPLARLQLRLDGIEGDVCDAIAGDIAEMDAMVGSLLAFLGGEDDPEPPILTDVAVLAQTIVDEATDRGEDACYEGPDHLERSIRPTSLRRALTNLVENGLHYGGAVCVQVATAAGGVRLIVDDSGPGIPEDRLNDVLQPFTRLDTARARNTNGLGLGLAIVRRAVEQDGGRLSLANRPEGGLRAEMFLPATASAILPYAGHAS